MKVIRGRELTSNKVGECIYAWIRACERNWWVTETNNARALQDAYARYIGRPISLATIYKAWNLLGRGFQDGDSPVLLVWSLSYFEVNSDANNHFPPSARHRTTPKTLYKRLLSLKAGQEIGGGVLTKEDIARIEELNRSYWFDNINLAYQICKMVALAIKDSKKRRLRIAA